MEDLVDCACVNIRHRLHSELLVDEWTEGGYVIVKLYYKRPENEGERAELLAKLRRQDNLFYNHFRKHPTAHLFEGRPNSLLLDSFNRVFDNYRCSKAKQLFAHFDFYFTQLPIVQLQIIDKLKHGRLVRVTGGRSSGDSTAWWFPMWSKNVAPTPDFIGHSGSRVTSIKVAPDFGLNFPVCDVLRFQYEISPPIPFDRCLIKIDGQVSLGIFDSSTLIDIEDPPKPAKSSSNRSISSFQLPKFPLEVWLKIIECLDSPLKALTVLSGTCREWRQLFAHSFFYSKIDLKPLASKFHLASDEFFDFLMERCIKNVQHVRLSWLPYPPNYCDLFGKFFSKLPRDTLITLVADQCTPLDDDLLIRILQSQRKLQVLRLADCSNLTARSYKLIGELLGPELRRISLENAAITYLDLLQLTRDCSQLEVFEYVGTPFKEQLYKLDVDEQIAFAKELASILKNLRAIRFDTVIMSIGDGDELTTNADDFFRNLFQRNPLVEELFLHPVDSAVLNFDRLAKSLRRISPEENQQTICPNLRVIPEIRITITSSSIGSFLSLAKCLAKLSSNLQCLNIMFEYGAMLGPTEVEIGRLLEIFPNLRQLSLYWNYAVDLAQFAQPDEMEAINLKYPHCAISVGKCFNNSVERTDCPYCSDLGAAEETCCPEVSFRMDFPTQLS